MLVNVSECPAEGGLFVGQSRPYSPDDLCVMVSLGRDRRVEEGYGSRAELKAFPRTANAVTPSRR